MQQELERELEAEVQARLDAIRADPERLMRYDANGDGVIDDEEWEEVRRTIRAEVQTERRRAKEGEPQEEHELAPEAAEVLKERYEIGEKIGRGGQGWTYRGRDRTTGEPVAIKELDMKTADTWKAVELFEREAKVLESLDHLAIPDYVDSFHIERKDGRGERFFLVQQFVEGKDLETLIDDGVRLNEEQAKGFIEEMLQILEYLHSHSPPVIHRDIKPSNIIRQPNNRLALIDFGAVQAVTDDGGHASTVVGTSGYMPLEQLMGRAVPATDLYGLAATAVHLLSHRHPADLPVEQMALKFQRFVNLSAPMEALLEQMLEPHVEDRLRSATEARAMLRGRPASGAAGIAFGRPEPQPAAQGQSGPSGQGTGGGIAKMVGKFAEYASEQARKENQPEERPATMKSNVEVKEQGIEVEVPRGPVIKYVALVIIFVVAGIGAPVVIGMDALNTQEYAKLLLAPVFPLAFCGAAYAFYISGLCRVSIESDEQECVVRRTWPHGEKSAVIDVDDIQSVMVNLTRSSNNGRSKTTRFIEMEWGDQPAGFWDRLKGEGRLKFGTHLPIRERRYIAHEMRKAFGLD